MAVTIDAAGLRNALGLEDDAAGNAEATRLLAIASAACNLEGATVAPAEVADEAVTRTAAYLLADDASARVLRRVKAGEDVDVEIRPAGSAVRLSGARILLAPYRPRGLVVATDD